MLRRCFALLCVALVIAGSALAQSMRIDPARSTVTVRAFKSGLFSAFAHDHEIVAPIESGAIDLRARTVELSFDARQMKVLDPKLAADKRAEVQQTMQTQVLESSRYPKIRFVSTEAKPGGNGTMIVSGTLTIRGHTQPVVLEVREENGTYTGQARIKQRSFGIEPVSVAGGTVKVKDELLIEFRVVTAAGENATRVSQAR